MKKEILQLGRDYINQKQNQMNTWLAIKKNQLQTLIQKYGWKTALTIFVGLLLWHKDIHIQIGKNNTAIASVAAYATSVKMQPTNVSPSSEASFGLLEFTPSPTPQKTNWKKYETPKARTTSLSHLPETDAGFWSRKENSHAKKAVQTRWKDDGSLSNTYDNLTYNLKGKKLTPAQQKKRKKQVAYIQRFLKVAESEMEKFAIPASITLAQGLLESNVGESRLATKNKNHFGIKCFSRSCHKGHCSNFTDDSHKDFFRKYGSVWESYRAHSKMLSGKRYKHLKKLSRKDYKGWAKGLKKAGYATDKRYAEKLINLIEELALHEFDK